MLELELVRCDLGREGLEVFIGELACFRFVLLRKNYLVIESAVERSRKFASVDGGSIEVIVFKEGVALGVEVDVLAGRAVERFSDAGSSNPSSSDSPLLLSKFH